MRAHDAGSKEIYTAACRIRRHYDKGKGNGTSSLDPAEHFPRLRDEAQESSCTYMNKIKGLNQKKKPYFSPLGKSTRPGIFDLQGLICQNEKEKHTHTKWREKLHAGFGSQISRAGIKFIYKFVRGRGELCTCWPVVFRVYVYTCGK